VTRRPGAHNLSVKIAGDVAWLRLQRPRSGNCITQDLAQALCDAAEEIEHDERVHVVVLAAAGPSFCSGVEEAGEWTHRIDWIEAIARLSRPVVAAIQGDAISEGLELALACDLRVASARARFSLPQLSEGRLPSHGGTQRLPRLIGRTRALDLLFTGRTITAREGSEMGLVTRVFPHAGFARGLQRVIAELRAKGPVALRFAKEAVLEGSDLTLDQGIRLEEDLYVLLQTTRDRQEGVRAFLQKRRPVFRGR
jgi:enoyl-CoA hydratase